MAALQLLFSRGLRASPNGPDLGIQSERYQKARQHLREEVRTGGEEKEKLK